MPGNGRWRVLGTAPGSDGGRAAAPALATDASTRCPSWPPWRGRGRRPSGRRRRRPSPLRAAACEMGGRLAATRALSGEAQACEWLTRLGSTIILEFERSVANRGQCCASRSYGSRHRPAARAAAGPTAAPSRRAKTCGCPRREGRRIPQLALHVVRGRASTARLHGCGGGEELRGFGAWELG